FSRSLELMTQPARNLAILRIDACQNFAHVPPYVHQVVGNQPFNILGWRNANLAADVPGNRLQQGRLLDRLGKVLRTPGRKAAAASLSLYVRGKREYRHRMCMSFCLPLADGASG